MNTYEITYYSRSSRLYGRVRVVAKTKTKAVDLWFDSKYKYDEFIEIKLLTNDDWWVYNKDIIKKGRDLHV